jgi:dUTP pyrophosphatase
MQVQLLEGGIQPVRKTQGAAAYDLFAPEPVALQVGLNKVKLKIKIQLPPNTFGSIRCRSSLAKDGITVEAGVIDEDYRGEVAVLLRSHTEACLYPKGHAIAQLIIQPYLKPDVYVVDKLDDTVRGTGGFGSTNKFA